MGAIVFATLVLVVWTDLAKIDGLGDDEDVFYLNKRL